MVNKESKKVRGNRKSVQVAFLVTHPIQYFAPLYAYLNQFEELSVSALYLSDYSVRGGQDRAFGQTVKWDIDLLEGYDARFVPGADTRDEPTSFLSMIVPELWCELWKGRFDALVIHGHMPAAYLIGMFCARVLGIRVFMRCETHLGLERSSLKRRFRRPLIGALYRSCDGVLAIGSANVAFYRALGVPEGRIFVMPYAVDNARFTTDSTRSDKERSTLRSQFGVHDDSPIVLFAAKLQSRKRPDDLLRAAARLNRDALSFHLLIVGSGEMKDELRNLATQLGVHNVHFYGFVNQRELPSIYGACDIFVLPSGEEPWGLAVNEAMCAGLPIVASTALGCVPDLVKEDQNGRTFVSGDIEGLAEAMRALIVDPETRRAFGRASREIIRQWSFAECGKGLRAALASVGLGSTDRGEDPAR